MVGITTPGTASSFIAYIMRENKVSSLQSCSSGSFCMLTARVHLSLAMSVCVTCTHGMSCCFTDPLHMCTISSNCPLIASSYPQCHCTQTLYPMCRNRAFKCSLVFFFSINCVHMPAHKTTLVLHVPSSSSAATNTTTIAIIIIITINTFIIVVI